MDDDKESRPLESNTKEDSDLEEEPERLQYKVKARFLLPACRACTATLLLLLVVHISNKQDSRTFNCTKRCTEK